MGFGFWVLGSSRRGEVALVGTGTGTERKTGIGGGTGTIGELQKCILSAVKGGFGAVVGLGFEKVWDVESGH